MKHFKTLPELIKPVDKKVLEFLKLILVSMWWISAVIVVDLAGEYDPVRLIVAGFMAFAGIVFLCKPLEEK